MKTRQRIREKTSINNDKKQQTNKWKLKRSKCYNTLSIISCAQTYTHKMIVELNWGLIHTSNTHSHTFSVLYSIFIALSHLAQQEKCMFYVIEQRNETTEKNAYAYAVLHNENAHARTLMDAYNMNIYIPSDISPNTYTTNIIFFNQLCDRISIAPLNCITVQQHAKEWTKQKEGKMARERARVSEWKMTTETTNGNCVCGNSVSYIHTYTLTLRKLRKWNK